MGKTRNLTLSMLSVAGMAFLGLLVSGCGSNDSAPTNTKNSQYMGGGDTSADKVAADRAAAHKPRLPGKGVQPN